MYKQTATPLTELQRSVISRLNVVGLEDLAARAMVAWRDGSPLHVALTPAEKATMEGAKLCNDLEKANAEALREHASAP